MSNVHVLIPRTMTAINLPATTLSLIARALHDSCAVRQPIITQAGRRRDLPAIHLVAVEEANRIDHRAIRSVPSRGTFGAIRVH